MGQGQSSERSRLRLPSAKLYRRSRSLPPDRGLSPSSESPGPATPSLYRALRSRLLRRAQGSPAAKAAPPLLASLRSSAALKGKAARDHARLFRDLVAAWSPAELHCLLVEFEASAALKELKGRADAARPAPATLAKDLGALLESGACADVILVYEASEFPAHSALLSARSAFFARLLRGTALGDRVEVRLPPALAGLEAAHFSLLLRYLYTGEVEGVELDRILRLKKEFGCPRTLEQDAWRLAEAAPEAGDALLSFVAHAPTPLPPEAGDFEEEEAGEGSGTLRASTSRAPLSGGQDEASSSSGEEAEDGTVEAGGDLSVWRVGLSETQPQGSRSRPLSLASTASAQAEFRCHSVILAARSPFFRGLIQRRLRERLSGGAEKERGTGEPIAIQLDEAVLPRLYAPVLLHALYTDRVEVSRVLRGCSLPANSLHEVQAIASGKCQVSPIDEATELFTLAQFLQFPSLAHGCESLIVQSLSLDSVVGVHNWAIEGHGSAFVRRHCVAYLATEFARVAASPLLLDLEEELLYDVLRSDFVQAAEVEILEALIRWGEATLMRRLEEQEPNLVATTSHSIARKGLRRSELSDAQVREVLANLLPLVRPDFVLPPFHPALVAATARGLVPTTSPLDLPSTSSTLQRSSISRRSKSSRLGGSCRVIEGRGLGNPDAAWLHSHPPTPSHVTIAPRPRLFAPYVAEASHQLARRLSDDPSAPLLSHSPASSATLPDALYMLSSPASLALEEEERWSWGSEAEEEEDAEEALPPQETLAAAEERVRAQLRASTTVSRGLACGCAYHRREILRQLRLRAVRELGLPDWAVRVLKRGRRRGERGQGEEAAESRASSLSRGGEDWPDLMSSAGDEGERELREACAAVTRWTIAAAADDHSSEAQPHPSQSSYDARL